MSDDIVIRAEGLGKKYLIDHQAQRESYVALRDVLAGKVRALARSARNVVAGREASTGTVEEFWALQDATFEIARGDVVGVIGRNGAGKSTLLKILSRITEPTVGRVRLRGRIASLLEVGTGFHPELTGRENIYLNGSILGMTRNEIRRKFDEIVAFAEVERFLDTPVKRYSSGMYVRLAFAVAAHLEPEILVIDEVLAVGDVKFQEKCLGKMEMIGKGGRTVIFVSHNMQAVRRLCSRAIHFSQGRLIKDGEVEAVITDYLEQGSAGKDATQDGLEKLIGNLPADPDCRLIHVGLLQEGVAPSRVKSAEPLEIVFEYEILRETFGFHAFFHLLDNDGSVLFESQDCAEDNEIPTVAPGRYRSTAIIPANLLAPRKYEIAFDLGIAYRRHCLPEPIRIPFEVELTGLINQCFVGYVSPGKLLPSIPWKIEKR